MKTLQEIHDALDAVHTAQEVSNYDAMLNAALHVQHLTDERLEELSC